MSLRQKAENDAKPNMKKGGSHLSKLLDEISNDVVKILCCLLRVCTQTLLIFSLFNETRNLLQVGNQTYSSRAIIQTTGPDHANKAQGIADFSDKLSEFVHQRRTIIKTVKFFNFLIELFCPFPGILVTKLIPTFLVKFLILQKTAANVIIKHECGKYSKLLGEKLICEIDSCIHHAGAMRSNGVGDLLDANALQVLAFCWPLNEHLRVEIVRVSGNKYMNVSHDL